MKEKQICEAFFAQAQQMLTYSLFEEPFELFHVPNGFPAYTPSLKLYLAAQIRMGMKKGISDYIAMNGKKVIAIEYKRPKGGKFSPEQKAFEERCNNLGIPYYKAKTVEEGLDALRKEFGSREVK